MILIYSWNTTRKYLIHQLFPEADRVEAHYNDSLEKLQRLIDEQAPTSFVFHLNLTFTHLFPVCRAALLKFLSTCAVRTINGSINDISRGWIRQQCAALDLPSTAASLEGNPDELLIVKSYCNHGAKSERMLGDEARSVLQIPSVSRLVPSEEDYFICTRSDIRSALWNDPGISVEKFISNPDDYFYRAFVYGRRIALTRAVVPSQIKKLAHAIRRDLFFGSLELDTLDAVSPIRSPLNGRVLKTLSQFISSSGIDFAAFDLVEDEKGDVYIIDVNTTPYWGGVSQWQDYNLPCYGHILEHLRNGGH